MKTENTWSGFTGYQPTSGEKSRFHFPAGLRAIANRFWHSLAEGLVNSAEPQIWQEVNHRGQVVWYAYNPSTEQRFSGSEAEMRRWIEQRYSR